MLTLYIDQADAKKNGIRLLSTTTMSYQHPIHLAVVGVGLVGSEFMNQLLSLPPTSPFRIVALSSSKRSLFLDKDNAITTGNPWDWKTMLASSPTAPDLWTLTAHLSALVQANEKVALVDNTSSDEVALLYPTWLRSGIHVVTPNKKAFSGEADLYDEIVRACNETGTKCLHEATVGAGLPIIAPLKEILATGDKVSCFYFLMSPLICCCRSRRSKVCFLGPCPTSSMNSRPGNLLALLSPLLSQRHVRKVSPYVFFLMTVQYCISLVSPRNHTLRMILTVKMLLENLPSFPESSPICPLLTSLNSKTSLVFKQQPLSLHRWRISKLAMSSSGDSPLQIQNLQRSERLPVGRVRFFDLSA